MADRDCSRNAGFISTAFVPEQLWVAGYVLVTMDEDGNYGTVFGSESLDDLPTAEMQEYLGPAIAQAWALANNPGLAEARTEGEQHGE